MEKSPDAFRTISEVADWLDVPAHVLRFWESRFTQVKPVKRAGGRRYYRRSDIDLLDGIRKLLHEDGMTIRGVQKLLREDGIKSVQALARPMDGTKPEPVGEAPMAADVVPPPEEARVVPFRRGAAEADKAPEPQPAEAPAPHESGAFAGSEAVLAEGPAHEIEAAEPADETAPEVDTEADSEGSTTEELAAALWPDAETMAEQDALSVADTDNVAEPEPPEAPDETWPEAVDAGGDETPDATPEPAETAPTAAAPAPDPEPEMPDDPADPDDPGQPAVPAIVAPDTGPDPDDDDPAYAARPLDLSRLPRDPRRIEPIYRRLAEIRARMSPGPRRQAPPQ